MTRRCTTCNQTKPLSEFGRLASGPDGKNTKCYACVRAAYHKFNGRDRATKEKVADEQRLRKLKQLDMTVAQPNRIDIMHLDVYVPATNAYYRNDGLKNIPTLTR